MEATPVPSDITPAADSDGTRKKRRIDLLDYYEDKDEAYALIVILMTK